MQLPIDRPEPGGDNAIQATAETLGASVWRNYPAGTLARRDAHPKHPAILRAQFRINADIPAELHRGVLATPSINSYTPCHTVAERALLGGVNRTRRVVYEAVSRARHELNGVPRSEPSSLALEEEDGDAS